MKISKVKIHNFRSICDLEMRCETLAVMLGPNNHGKSNIISALEFALTTSAKPTESDFYSFREEDMLWVELTFNQLTEQEKNTFKKYFRGDGSICIRKSARLLESGSVEISYNGYINEPLEWWLKNDSVSRLTKREETDATPLRTLVPSGGKLTKAHIEEAQAKYLEAHQSDIALEEMLESGQFLGQKNVAGGILPDFYLVPAVRELSDEAKIKTTTAFGRLLTRAIREMAEQDQRFQDLKEGLGKLVKVLNRNNGESTERPTQLEQLEQIIRSELMHWGVNVEIEVVPPVIEKIFELGTNLHLDDGVRTLAEQKGHGLQRAVMFAFIRAWANVIRTPIAETETGTRPRASSELAVFAIEEPELFLHPHAQRKLAVAIQQLAQSSNHQVFICTHSTHFVDLDQYKKICIISKPNPKEGTKVRQCDVELFTGETAEDRKRRFHLARWVNPDRAEMFFAKRVAFVEGETEKTLFPYLAEKYSCLDNEVSIIDCGSKHNLPFYIAIANAFKIHYIVVHDEDPLPEIIPETWNENKRREKQRTFELNEEIRRLIDTNLGKVEMLSPDFEGISGISKSQGERKGKPIAALDYFESIDSDKHPQRIAEVVKVIYC